MTRALASLSDWLGDAYPGGPVTLVRFPGSFAFGEISTRSIRSALNATRPAGGGQIIRVGAPGEVQLPHRIRL